MDFKMRLWAIFACLMVMVIAQQQSKDKQIKVDVYYESLCPDSRKFITTQLYPALQGNLSPRVNLTLVPYGKSTTHQQGNEVDFTCHHGPNECWGNRLHACAITNLRTTSPQSSLGFITCLMRNSARNDSLQPEQVFESRKKCALDNNVSNLNLLENCVNHPDGATYLEQMGKLTDKLQKPLKSVPTVVVDGEISAEAVDNFKKVVCGRIVADKPSECTSIAPNSGAGLKPAFLGVVFMVSVFLYRF